MDDINVSDQQGINPADSSQNDISDDGSYSNYLEQIKERAFLGVPIETLFEDITTQFEDYINLENSTNLVDVFYNQLDLSYDKVINDASEIYPNEIKEYLDSIHQRFVDMMRNLFKSRLTIAITDLEGEMINREDLEYIIRRLYEFFIIGAKTNFKVVIAKDISSNIDSLKGEEEEYFKTLQGLIDNYSPLITTITPTQFLQYRGDQEIFDLFENGRVTGNFLRKYSPKIYQNEEYVVDLINYITMTDRFKKSMEDSLEGIS